MIDDGTAIALAHTPSFRCELLLLHTRIVKTKTGTEARRRGEARGARQIRLYHKVPDRQRRSFPSSPLALDTMPLVLLCLCAFLSMHGHDALRCFALHFRREDEADRVSSFGCSSSEEVNTLFPHFHAKVSRLLASTFRRIRKS